MTKVTKKSALLERAGVGVGVRLLASGERDERERGVERLASLGTPRALEALLAALEPSGAVRTTEERLIAARALAPHADDPKVRQTLVRLMSSGGPTDNDKLELLRGVAALALAQAGSDAALEVLGKALRSQGPVARAARQALLAHPPRDLSPVLHARGAPTVELVELLASLSDQRAFNALRSYVQRATPEVRARAALALTELGDLETVALARHWLRHERDPALRVAAARILVLVRAADAPVAIQALLRHDETSEQALELALEAPNPALTPEYVKRLDAGKGNTAALLSALGRAGGPAALERLKRALAEPKLAVLAAYALALSPDSAAADVLETALSQPAQRRMAARAAVVRAASLGQRVSGLSAALDALLASNSAADRAAGAWGWSVLDPARAATFLSSKDAARVLAAARGARRDNTARVAARRLVKESNPQLRTALAVALASRAGADQVPTSELLRLLDAGGPVAIVAARAFAQRDTRDLRPRIENLLSSGDPEVRGQTALGLGESRDPSSVALLTSAYRFELSPEVRRSIISALSFRKEPGRERVLRLARDLDPDPEVRARSRLALAGRRLQPVTGGTGALWVDLQANTSGDPIVLLVRTPGDALLVLAPDPDGLVVACGLPAGLLDIRVASARARDNATSSPEKPR